MGIFYIGEEGKHIWIKQYEIVMTSIISTLRINDNF